MSTVARERQKRARREGGVSLPELLVVVATIALVAAVAVPQIQLRVREGRVRWAASQFSVVLRSTRMIAIGNGQPARVELHPAPENRYEYPDNSGHPQDVVLPVGVRLMVEPPLEIAFRANGSVEQAPAAIRFETDLDSETTERWTIQLSLAGSPSLVRERLARDAEVGPGAGS